MRCHGVMRECVGRLREGRLDVFKNNTSEVKDTSQERRLHEQPGRCGCGEESAEPVLGAWGDCARPVGATFAPGAGGCDRQHAKNARPTVFHPRFEPVDLWCTLR